MYDSTNFGTLNNLPPVSGSYFEFNNINSYSSIGFYLGCPANGKVNFQGSFDGINFEPITMRAIGSDGYTQMGTSSGSYVGSISTLRKFRAVVFTGLSTGYIMGRVSHEQSVLEGIEHNPPPHKIGQTPFHRGIDIAGQQTSGIIYNPTSGKRFVLTDMTFSVGGGAATVLTIFDEIDNSSNWVYISEFESSPANGAIRVNEDFSLPFVSSNINNKLRITNSGVRSVKGVFHGYEAD